MMYKNIQATVLNNGNTCGFFSLQRGVRQGCPMSAYLFIIALEVLANSIRKNELIKGFKIAGREIKLSMLADVMTCILNDIDSVNNILKTLDRFKECSGLHINVEKTQAKYIGSLKGWDYYPHGLSWIKKPMEVLGIVFTTTDNDNYRYNFESRIKNLKTVLNIWKQRKLSLKGKVTILNTLALPSLIYVSSVKDTPKRAIEEINKIILDFMWDGKTSKISRKTHSQNIEDGGLKLCDFETKVKALKLSWVKRLTTSDKANWKIFPTLFYGCNNLSLYFYANQNMLQNKAKSKIPQFYHDIHNLWMLNFRRDPSNIQEVTQESIWLNKYITSAGSTLYWKKWVENNIITIGDILNTNGSFLSHEEISDKYNISCNFLQILQIRQGIPHQWKQILIDANNISLKPYLPFKITCNKVTKPVFKITCKEIYWHIIGRSKHCPSSKEKWYKSFPLMRENSIELWPDIYKLPFIITRETKLQSFQYKIIHRIIACNKWLFNIKIKDSSRCSYCECEDNIQHFFLNCDNVRDFWGEWQNWWNRCTGMDLSKLETFTESTLLGYRGDDDITVVLNLCALLAKYYIYIRKMYENNSFDMYQYLVLLKQKLSMEKHVLKSYNNLSSFSKFEIIYSCL